MGDPLLFQGQWTQGAEVGLGCPGRDSLNLKTWKWGRVPQCANGDDGGGTIG